MAAGTVNGPTSVFSVTLKNSSYSPDRVPLQLGYADFSVHGGFWQGKKCARLSKSSLSLTLTLFWSWLYNIQETPFRKNRWGNYNGKAESITSYEMKVVP